MSNNLRQSDTAVMDDEITLKELILKIREYFREVISNWKLIAITAFFFILYFLVNAWLSPTIYTANLSFMLNEEEVGGNNSSAILGQLGLQNGQGGVNYNKMIALSQSRKIIGMVLFEKIEIKGKNDFIANHIIHEYDYHKKWEDSKGLNGFLFHHNNLDSFSTVENSAFKSLHSFFIRESDGLMSLIPDDQTEILILAIRSTNQNLSMHCSKILYEKLGKYYIEKAVSKQTKTYLNLKHRTDSLDQILKITQRALLKFEDRNRNLSLRQYGMESLTYQEKLKRITLTYSETYKQLQIAEYALQDKTPFITTIDEPIYPLHLQRESRIKAILLGGFVGVFLMSIFLVLRKIYRDTMREEISFN